MNTVKHESGFTLIELLVSITLGLLITAAAMQVFITSNRSVQAQQASSNIQTSGLFGVQTLAKRIRMANYGAGKNNSKTAFVLNDTTPYGGIVLSAVPSTSVVSSSPIMASLMVSTPVSDFDVIKTKNSNSIPSHLKDKNSDQLTIQLKVEKNMFDCEGNQINATVDNPLQLLERYFVRANPAGSNNLALVCKAAIYRVNQIKDANNKIIGVTHAYQPIVSGATATTLVGNGEVQVDNVDHFGILLGVDTGVNSDLDPANVRINYVTPTQYENLWSNNRPKIRSLKVGLIIRSDINTDAGADNSEQRFNFLNHANAQLKDAIVSGPKFQREVYETTILMRNARG